MAGRVIKFAAAAFGAIVLVFGLWFFRPWSEYSPSEVIFDREFGDYVDSYRSFDDTFPHMVIKGAKTPYQFPRNEQPLNITYEWQGETKSLEQFTKEGIITGIVVLKDGVLVHESYYLGETARSRHTSWSVAKSYTATLIGIALKDGKIVSLDDTVEMYAPQFTGTDYGNATLRHLLMMSSGIGFNENYFERGSDIRKLFFNTFLLNQNVDKQVARYKLVREPGGALDYISPNTHVLSAVVRSVYNKPLAEVASQKLYQPVGMADASWSQDRKGKAGKAIGYCCLNTTVRDYAKFGQLYLQGGEWQGKQILPEGWVDLISTPPAQSHAPGKSTAPTSQFGYGLHFWLPPGADEEFYAAGFNGQYIWIDRKRNIVIARTAADPDNAARAPEMVTVMRAIAKEVAGY